MYSINYETRYGDFKTRETIKPSVVMDFIQDIATRHSEECGFGMNKLKEMGIAWLMQGIKIHFESPVKTFSTVTASTAVKNMKGVVSERGTYIFQEEKLVAKAVAAWFILDTNRMRPIRIPSEIAEKYDTYDFDDFFSYEKPQLLEADKKYRIVIRNKEIDTNNHLNNQKSAEILMDALPFDFYFTDMNVFYKKAAYLGDELNVCVKETENGYYVHLETLEKEICVAGIFIRS